MSYRGDEEKLPLTVPSSPSLLSFKVGQRERWWKPIEMEEREAQAGCEGHCNNILMTNHAFPLSPVRIRLVESILFWTHRMCELKKWWSCTLYSFRKVRIGSEREWRDGGMRIVYDRLPSPNLLSPGRSNTNCMVRNDETSRIRAQNLIPSDQRAWNGDEKSLIGLASHRCLFPMSDRDDWLQLRLV